MTQPQPACCDVPREFHLHLRCCVYLDASWSQAWSCSLSITAASVENGISEALLFCGLTTKHMIRMIQLVSEGSRLSLLCRSPALRGPSHRSQAARPLGVTEAPPTLSCTGTDVAPRRVALANLVCHSRGLCTKLIPLLVVSLGRHNHLGTPAYPAPSCPAMLHPAPVRRQFFPSG